MFSTVAFAVLGSILVTHCHAGLIFTPHPLHGFPPRPCPRHFGLFGPFHGLGGQMVSPGGGYLPGYGKSFQDVNSFGNTGLGSYQYFNYDQIQNGNVYQGGQGFGNGNLQNSASNWYPRVDWNQQDNWRNAANNWYPTGNWNQQSGSSLGSTAIQTLPQNRPGSIVQWDWNEPDFHPIRTH
ncbi:uncharacterized protein LOC127845522 [Dreissena polymorpha]|uniref:Secreted protein n=1 Tax=Dreissena polymorpha TaxID=45954 RepID=A0A9D4N4P3_DREPO|nr:uncharacterized protein LOC127845522 [Dreissena polymorpha]XP_052232496.1 uncharacterized protein LOC127845522 [Dreissena polymorpha]KAH3887961.1 hypothetical protein DPMN_011983 [Dreissena polymorpha]